ncbi:MULTISPECIES: ABC transporter permease [Azorhizobium]|uniref:Nitrate ABC transporter permease protein n=1 Tax=Azorhizobium caulinodans (strain ATCC 43989 / DSM 5975 / JCM 20966 / LMG 6465 / NBRC 14845 / NCIMB 13405 / ORS 571) TaxID=438753 RepID=A8HZ07_AZOC5|nr:MULTISPECIES: ABC transporter permease [Azorhizobium]TDT91232.1 ABC-2 type transport system permease protein [Azorhizobium sp. AG788]BAF90520.1 nitrate ABC transporter permease protein [Azorhizobium caulinodans ORS 571]
MSAGADIAGFLRRVAAMVRKEFIQLRRDRVTFATMIMIPLLQLILFGYAINTTPRHLPTAVFAHENTEATRAILAALKNTAFFNLTHEPRSEAEAEHLIRSGDVLFMVEIPAGFERALRRGETPQLLVAADATDPVASGNALGALSGVVTSALTRARFVDAPGTMPFEIVQHRRYNPAGTSQLNIVPGLLGTILTMTMLIFTALSVTREVERGTMESLLSMPIHPVEIMLGKIIPYVLVGIMQGVLILGAGMILFNVPLEGSLALLSLATLLFITANLATGYTFSTLAQNQLQAVQMTFMYFLPNILLSGFMFPFAGMPVWAQWISECLPLTHYLRMVRGILLKGATLVDVQSDMGMLALLMLAAMAIAVRRFRQTLD